MKKRNILLMCAIIFCLLLCACGAKTENDKDNLNDNSSHQVEELTNNSNELKEPTMEWWELYNSCGFDYFTAVITNPNSASIDITYNIIFLKDGKEVARQEEWASFNIMPGKKEIIWANVDIPKSNDVDDVKIEYTYVGESYYPSVDGKYEYIGIKDDNKATFKFTFDEKPTLANITFLLYNDNNSNGEFDKGEIVGIPTMSLTEQTGEAYFETDVFPYTNYEVFFNAYKE